MATRSTKKTLEDLPSELLQKIAGRLQVPSLQAFSLASKACHSAATPSLFRKLHLTVHSCKALQRDADTLIEILSRTGSARYVRCLRIKGALHLDVTKHKTNVSVEDYSGLAWLKEQGVDEIFEDEEPVFSNNGWHTCTESVIERASEEDMAWAPIVNLMRILPGLTTLEYTCRDQFPPILLDAVHEHHCRLHHMTFRLRSLLSETPDPYEMALATSSSLYKAQVWCAWRDSNGDDDFNEEAMMELAAGLAPNLKEVIVVGLRPPIPALKKLRPRGSWRGLPGFVSGDGIGSLTSLTFMGDVSLSLGRIQRWAQHTDFDHLRHLGLGGGYTTYELRASGMDEDLMEWMAQTCSLLRLKTLQIYLSPMDLVEEIPNYPDFASTLFKTLKPLDELSVTGSLKPKILGAILYQHGPTLKKLTLRPLESEMSVSNGRVRTEIPMTFEKEHVLQIQAQCPALKKLAVSVKRTKSDAVEAEVYKSFGKMERLQSLFLTLDCSDWRVTRDNTRRDDPSFDQVDRETYMDVEYLQKGHVRDALLNCAVDETLARSIWEAIHQEKRGRPLQSLKLWPSGGGHWGINTYNGLVLHTVQNLSRSWLIEVRDDKGTIDTKELGQRGRKIRELQERAYENSLKDARKAVAAKSGRCPVFRRIWARKEGSQDWREDWASLPLQS